MDDFSGPKVYATPAATSFFKNVLNLDLNFVALQFEAWVTAGLDKR